MAETVAGMLPEDTPAGLREAVVAHLGRMDAGSLMALVGDALLARSMLDAGDADGARTLMAPYRDQAEAAGLGPMFDAMLGDIGTAEGE